MSKEYISYQIDSLTLPARTNVSVNLGKAVKLSSIEMGDRWVDNNYLDITFKMNGDVVFEYRVSRYTDPFKYEFETIVECDEVVFRSNALIARNLPVPFIFYSKPQIKTLILSDGEYKRYVNPNKNLISYFSFDEDSGNTIVDNIRSLNGIAHNIERVPSSNGTALKFNGVNSKVEFSNRVIPSGNRAIIFKVKTNVSTRNMMLLNNGSMNGSRGGIGISINSGKVALYTYIKGNNSPEGILVSNKSISDNNWHDIVVTTKLIGNQLLASIYIDDLSSPDVQGYIPKDEDNNINFKIGTSGVTNYENFFFGEIDELYIYNEAINKKEKGWHSVSPILSTVQQFQEEGMEDLSVLDRQVQPVLDSPISMTREELGEGKVFKGKVDLKKYFDLRKLKIH